MTTVSRWATAFVLGLALVACGDDGEVEGATTGGGGGGVGGSGGAGGSGGSSGAVSGGGSGGIGGSGGSGGIGGGGGTSGGGTGGSTCKATLPAPTVVDAKTAPKLVIKNDPAAPLGIFDPSVEYPAGAPAGAMSYSAVLAKSSISTRIAVSSDKGASFTYVAAPNASADITVPVPVTSQRCPGGTCTGRLVHEVSSLVFDADDPDATRRWKLFTHSYVVLTGDQLAYDLGYIALFTAAEPLGPWKSEGKAVGWLSESVFSSKDALTNASTFAQLKDCVALTEPAAHWRIGGILDLAVGCVTVNPITIRVELLRSLDHGKTFSWSARLLGAEDATCVGASKPQLNAADIFLAQGKTWLLATPEGPLAGGGSGYRGCLLFELIPGGAGVKRDAAGAPIVTRVLDSADQRFTGACAVDEGATAMGYLVSQAAIQGSSLTFEIFASGQVPP